MAADLYPAISWLSRCYLYLWLCLKPYLYTYSACSTGVIGGTYWIVLIDSKAELLEEKEADL
jgi:hypothetical protein